MKTNANIYFWSALNQFGSPAISFIGNVLIARILSPDDYGLIAMLAIIISIAWNFMDSGFSDCLIRKTDADKKDFGTVMSFNVVVGMLMYLLIYTTAPLVAQYFNRSELNAISKVIGLTILINSLTITEFTRLRKTLEFKVLTIINMISNFSAIIICFIMAIYGLGYWALVFQTLVIGLVNIILIVVISKWRPYLYFSWRRFRNMSRYSFNLLISYLSNQLGNNLYSVFIGKFQITASLGFYRQAQKIKDVPIQGLNALILTTTYPILANEKDEVKRFQNYISLFKKFLFIQFLLVCLLIGVAYPLIYTLFGSKWTESVPYFQLMLIISLFYPVTSLNLNISKVYGKSQLYRNLAFLRNGLLLMALILTGKNSILLILYGQIAATYISIFIDMIFCGKIIGFKFKDQFKIIIDQLWIPLLALITSYNAVVNVKNSFLNLTLFIFIFSFIYIAINETWKMKVYINFKKYIIETITTFYNKTFEIYK